MAEFSDNDINEAKRRVWEMRNKASQFVDKTPEHNENINNKSNNKADELPCDNEPEQDKSFFVILALILLLSREGADNTLILALLYLLL